ncbi:MAG TPA: hypothetical protein VGZ47_03870, partial [Gemmataceae bacterium]|nr:hypothetical protein [Gemmataceae bacterium]
VRYLAEDRAQTVRPTTTRGVSSLLQGSKSALIPENSERMARRKRRALAVVDNEPKSDRGCHDAGPKSSVKKTSARSKKPAPLLLGEK